MRLGAPVYDYDCPESWISQLKAARYRAAYCPIGADADAQLIAGYRQAAMDADVVIAEVGAWSNPLSRDEPTRRAAVELCQRQLNLAEEIGATCCVNISGSRHPEIWDAAHADNLTPETFDLIVESVRAIIDAVRPRRTTYTLEPMPYALPDSAETYLQLIEAIDRPAFGVHLDLVNWINSPRRYFGQADFIEQAFQQLRGVIKSCHVKDIVMEPTLAVHFREVPPGEGAFDYRTFLRCAAQLGSDIPLMIEHLAAEQYPAAADHIREQARQLGLSL